MRERLCFPPWQPTAVLGSLEGRSELGLAPPAARDTEARDRRGAGLKNEKAHKQHRRTVTPTASPGQENDFKRTKHTRECSCTTPFLVVTKSDQSCQGRICCRDPVSCCLSCGAGRCSHLLAQEL